MVHRPGPSATAVFLASAIAAGGMLAHDVFEFGPAFLLDPQTLIPLGIFAILAILATRETAVRAIWIALFAWAVLNLLVGGILSVLPLGLFPFQPDQAPAHYGAHALYTLAEVPLVVVAWSGIRSSRMKPGTANVPEVSDIR